MTAPPPVLRIATYNVEWFDRLFDDLGRGYEDDQPSARYGISRGTQLGALGIVFTALDADGIMIIEGPDTTKTRSTVRALEGFAAKFGLRARRAVHGFSSETEQEIAFLYDPDRITAHHDPQGEATGRRDSPLSPRFDGVFRYDLDNDSAPDTIRFSKPPLELAVTLKDGRRMRMIGVHAKSKNPHGATDEAQAIRISIENRRKQLAQCIWLRARVDEILKAGENVMVMGDFNDGPGLDEFEKLFGKSGVEIVLGQDADPAMRLKDPHANMALCSRMGFCPTTARFWLAPQKRYFEALLDFIMLSPGLMKPVPEWRIWHPFQDPRILGKRDLSEALLQASDHFPVTVDLPL
ncbi:endonuclease [Xinfangfangia sp. D13-10-4-6]|uniref:endonuclease/exonuclease/phosphatase family protein n=1 Tax=Pseudogemmobacter hezensis TaxID=2737662 RepID=UPI0015562C46|nr:endonuclease/exonuclease/phosphatase family protein [Pseudogemmobacter hezensis]NPD14035.1 endonuclease [Pseudogemmobacter hezensis]